LACRLVWIGDAVGPALDARRSAACGIRCSLDVSRLPKWSFVLSILYGRRGADFPATKHMAPDTMQAAREVLPGADRQLVNEKADPPPAGLRLRGSALSCPVIGVFGEARSIRRQLFVPQVFRPCERAIKQQPIAETPLELQVHGLIGMAGAVYIDC